MIGEGHKVYNNYIEGTNVKKPSGASSSLTGGINVMNGVQNSALNGYYQVKNAQIVNNTLVNCDYALRIGTDKGGNNTLESENLIVANNIVLNATVNSYEIETTPSGNSISEGNITNLSASDLSDDGSFHRLTNGSAAIAAGLGSYSYLTKDILGGTRDANFDAGAEEFGANGTNLPYTAADVDVTVGFGATYQGALNIDSNQLKDQGISIYPVPLTDGKLTITSTEKPLNTIEIYSIEGKQVFSTQGNSTHEAQIELTNLQRGVYFIKLENIGQRKIILK